MSGGGQSTGSQTTTQTMPPWLQDAGQGFLGAASQVAQLPFQPYTGQRVADLSPLQQGAIQGIGNLASGLPSMGSAESMLNQTLQGGFSNPYAGQRVSSGSNPYMGFGPQFNNVLQSGAQDITDAYNRGTSADTTRMFNLAGAFGGSANQQAIANNERELGRTLNNYTSGMMNDQYNRSGQLAESGLGRDLNAQQFNSTLGSNAYENERNRQMGAVGASTGLYGAYGQGLNNALNAGNVERGQQQDLLNSQYGDFQRWLDYPQQQLGIYGNALGSVLGTAPRTSTTTGQTGASDNVSQGLGIYALANMLGKGGGSSKGGG